MSIHQRTKSLQARGNELSDTFIQLKVLNSAERALNTQFQPFAQAIEKVGFLPLRPLKTAIFQINIGKMCNQTCAHCHVDAGPDRKEMMSRENLEKCLDILAKCDISTVDITGGAPEMHPDFRWFVAECTKLGKKVMNRCNLTIIVANKKYHDLPAFFAQNKVHIVSSLPYFSKSRTDAQRGDGVFEDSIKALQMLNAVGYGAANSDLILDLVFNPSGAFLPGSQTSLEREFKAQLKRRYQVVFNRLLAITNMPISRFLEYLLESDNYEEYMQLLISSFNPAAVAGVMCRNTISVSWDGFLYDCDFNQMLNLKVKMPLTEGGRVRPHLDNFDLGLLSQREIIVNQHCYGCTAGSGSSCGGEIA
jgi:radical SAM/Cys-rich protein